MSYKMYILTFSPRLIYRMSTKPCIYYAVKEHFCVFILQPSTVLHWQLSILPFDNVTLILFFLTNLLKFCHLKGELNRVGHL